MMDKMKFSLKLRRFSCFFFLLYIFDVYLLNCVTVLGGQEGTQRRSCW